MSLTKSRTTDVQPVTGRPVRTWRAIMDDGKVLESKDAKTLFQWADLFTGNLRRFEVVSPVHGVLLRVHLGPEDRLIYRDRSRYNVMSGQWAGNRYLIGFQRAGGFMSLVEVDSDGRVTVSPGPVPGQRAIPFQECERP